MHAESPSHTPNVKVSLRVRPLNAKEKLLGSTDCIYCASNGPQIVVNGEKSFAYDTVISPDSTQSDVFNECVQPLMQRFVEGYNVTIIAYGQTGSGKTFTMGTGFEGTISEDYLGIVPRAVGFIFNHIHNEQQRHVSSSDGSSKIPEAEMMETGDRKLAAEAPLFEIYVSFLEIYNEEIIDLLNPQPKKGPPLTIREDASGDIYLAGLKEEAIGTSDEIFDLLKKGTLCRTTGSTDMNMNSSRSHAIFSLVLRQIRSKDDQAIISKIHFVDLAGSERLKRTNAVGERAKESISINSGLLALGSVIAALSDDSGKVRHVPYRNSKLTRLLQDSLGGNSHTVMIACVSPSSDNYPETLSTLNYAARARNIRNKAIINQESASNSAFEISQLKKQISALKNEIHLLRGHASQLEDGDVALLQKQYNDLLKEKNDIEVERDTLLAITGNVQRDVLIEGYVKSINELTHRNRELERLHASNPQSQFPSTSYVNLAAAGPFFSTPTKTGGTPKRRQSGVSIHDLESACVSKLKISEFSDKLRVKINDARYFHEKTLKRCHVRTVDVSSQTSSAVAFEDSDEVLDYLTGEISLLEDFSCSVDHFKKEYLSMKEKYEDKIKQFSESLLQAQKQRDDVVKQLSVPPKEELNKQARNRYEDKIKKLAAEIKDLKEKLADNLRNSKTKTTGTDALIRNLKASLEVAKNEKAKLLLRLNDETNKKSTKDLEMREFRNKEKKAIELVKKWKKSFETQKEILTKRTEQVVYAKERIKSLTALLKSKGLGATEETKEFSSASKHHSDAPITDSASTCMEATELTETAFIFREVGEMSAYIRQELLLKRQKILDELQEAESTSRSMASYASPIKSPQEFKRCRLIDDRVEVLQSFASYFSEERIQYLQEETIKLLLSSVSAFPAIKNTQCNSQDPATFHRQDVYDSLVYIVQWHLHRTITELRKSLKRAISNGHLHPNLFTTPIKNESPIGAVLIDAPSADSNFSPEDRNSPLQRIATVESEDDAEIDENETASIFEESNCVTAENSAEMDVDADECTPQKASTVLLQCLHTFEGHLGQVYDVAHIGNSLYSASQDGTVKEWDAETATMTGNLVENSGIVRAIAAYDENSLFAASQSTIKRFCTRSKNCIATIANHSDDVYTLAVAENLLFSGSSDATVCVWDVRMHRVLATLTGHKGTVFSTAYVPELSLLFTASRDHAIRAYASDSFAYRRTLEPAHTDVVSFVQRIPRQDAIVSGSRDGTLRKWAISGTADDQILEVEAVRHVSGAHASWIKAGVFIDAALPLPTRHCEGGGGVICTGDKEGVIRLWDADLQAVDGAGDADSTRLSVFGSGSSRISAGDGVHHHAAIVNCLRGFSSIGNSYDDFLLSGSGDRTVKMWRLAATDGH